MSNNTDLTFFTNEPDQTLLDRFKATLKDTRFFDVLVGYFHASGFEQLADNIKGVDETRILIGIGSDKTTMAIINQTQQQRELLLPHEDTKQTYRKTLIDEIENTGADDAGLETSIHTFINLIKQQKLTIRAYPSRNIHAKVYIGRFAENDRDYGYVITGSSNFSRAGLVGRREFNVELRQRRDVDFALNQFNALWDESVDVTQTFIDTINANTWLSDTITPYDLYLKLIYEYLQEEINLQDQLSDMPLPDGYMALDYQKQAVTQALRILNAYGGVFLGDVVGLGKTYIAAQLLQHVKGRALIVCPPTLQDYWQEASDEFRLGAKVVSLGKLEEIADNSRLNYRYIVVDESHRFRSDGNLSYQYLHEICRDKKVILLTATAVNNKPDDLLDQLKLFQKPRQSTIPGINNLEAFFDRLKRRLKRVKKGSAQYLNTMNEISTEIRDKVLKHVMIRRTRADVLTYFKQDIIKQSLSFPKVQPPKRIIYTFSGKTEQNFCQTIEQLATLNYARYAPLLYYTGELSGNERQPQINMRGFMKSMVIKRLESSLYAFSQTIGRLIESYQAFIDMYHQGTIYIGKNVNIDDLLDDDDAIGAMQDMISKGKLKTYPSDQFKPDFITHLEADLAALTQIKHIWQDNKDDPKLNQLINDLKDKEQLKNNKLIIFTESYETGSYLFDSLSKAFSNEMLFFSSKGGTNINNKSITHKKAKAIIAGSFDPNYKQDTDTIRTLITTDVLAEGVNLHQSNTIINYDLPWNPAKVMQRIGRVNRLGTKHDKIFIYNFFPTSQADKHLKQEENITNKIAMFHNMLGEDAKYLTESEQPDSRQLFQTLNKAHTYDDEDSATDPELKYLQVIRDIRDNDPDLFSKIKYLPKKARAGRKLKALQEDELITFIRLGALKKFYQTSNSGTQELTFPQAAKKLACPPSVRRHKIPTNYYDWLKINKEAVYNHNPDAEPAAKKGGRSNNTDYITRRLKDPQFKNCQSFTDDDDIFIRKVTARLQQGDIDKRTAKELKQALESEGAPLKMLAILRKHISQSSGEDNAHTTTERAGTNKREIILSAYHIAPAS